MRCSKYKEDIVFYLYEELSEGEKTRLETHVKECADCRRDLEYSKKVFHVLDAAGEVAVPGVNWEKSWTKINQGILPGTPKKKSFFQIPGWVYAAAGAALAAVFVFGVFLGRVWSPFGEQSATAEVFTQDSLQFTLNKHFEDIKPILVDYSNIQPPETGGEAVTVDKDLLRQLLIQNILLKRLLARQNPSAEQLLEDVEIVLREIDNLDKEDPRTSSWIKDLINQRDILYKMETLKTL